MQKKLFSIIILLSAILFSENRKEILDFAVYNKDIGPLLRLCKFNEFIEKMEVYLSPQEEITEEYTAYLERKCKQYDDNLKKQKIENLCFEKNINLAKVIDIEDKLLFFPKMISILSKKGEFGKAKEYLSRFKKIVDIEKEYYRKEKKAESILAWPIYERMMKPMIEKYEEMLKFSELEYEFYNKRSYEKILMECEKMNLKNPQEFYVLAKILIKKFDEALEICKKSKERYYCELLNKKFGLKLNIPENIENCFEDSIYRFLEGKKDKKDMLNEISNDLEELPVFKEIIFEILEGI